MKIRNSKFETCPKRSRRIRNSRWRRDVLIIVLELIPVLAVSASQGPFQPTWESVKENYRVPQWFLDGRFGIFMHWGVFSVPAHGSEWYAKYMYGSNREITQWHAENFGPQDKFGYKDFIPMFKAEKFDPKAWAELFRKAGARYVIPTAEHSDGWANWDSDLTHWDAKDMGPKRDLIGELARACRRQGLKFGVSNHSMEHYSFMYPVGDLKTDLFDPRYADFYRPPKQGPPDEDFQENYWFARNRELIEKYQPDIFWFDTGINSRDLDPIKLKLAAYYYNRAHEWGKAVLISSKSNAYFYGSVRNFETQGQAPKQISPYLWQVIDSVSNKFGYVEGLRYKDAGLLIRRLVDTVSKNGNYVLNISPMADGTIPEPQQERLLEIGKWLEINGQAIYGTSPWIRYGEGPYCDSPAGRIGDDPLNEFYSGSEFRFTTNDDILYAIIMDWPGPQAVIKSLASDAPTAGRIKSVHLLGHEESLIEITIRQGLNRQIRRVLAKVGLPIKSLKRTCIGNLTARGIGIGKFRTLTKAEVTYLKKGESKS
jgi:alpha-L-fucosidase